MSLDGINVKDQTQLISDNLEASPRQITERLETPGVTTLHLKSRDEIAAVLANIIKSRSELVALKYVLGSHFELTFNSNPFNQIR